MLFLAIAMVMMLGMTITAYAEIWSSNKCRVNYNTSTKIMTVSAVSSNGAMKDYNVSGENCAPWSNYIADVREIQIQEGVTYIGDYAFCKCCDVTKVFLPSTLQHIGDRAFYPRQGVMSCHVYFTRPSASTGLQINGTPFSQSNWYLHYAGEGNYVLFNGGSEIEDGASLYKLSGTKKYTWEIPGQLAPNGSSNYAVPEESAISTGEQAVNAEAENEKQDDTAKQQAYSELPENTEYLRARTDAKAIKTKVKFAKARKGRKAVVKWYASAGADGYKITYSTSKKFAKKKTSNCFVGANTTSKTLKKLKAGKMYFVRVIPYKIVHNPNTKKDEKVYGKSTTKTFRAKR